ncbi:hypothetical protein Pcinc_039464 [Petrolisthes cinctipes]|uniref:Uncharacterized protein n=1 Tax=Petrolisthes cinctipes TaxID=88211 RepID=A0AAE1EKJ9_PETCI|nr:hypothetical protein Pcinc_039464 [Petrolisthes cinctipes]
MFTRRKASTDNLPDMVAATAALRGVSPSNSSSTNTQIRERHSFHGGTTTPPPLASPAAADEHKKNNAHENRKTKYATAPLVHRRDFEKVDKPPTLPKNKNITPAPYQKTFIAMLRGKDKDRVKDKDAKVNKRKSMEVPKDVHMLHKDIHLGHKDAHTPQKDGHTGQKDIVYSSSQPKSPPDTQPVVPPKHSGSVFYSPHRHSNPGSQVCSQECYQNHHDHHHHHRAHTPPMDHQKSPYVPGQVLQRAHTTLQDHHRAHTPAKDIQKLQAHFLAHQTAHAPHQDLQKSHTPASKDVQKGHIPIVHADHVTYNVQMYHAEPLPSPQDPRILLPGAKLSRRRQPGSQVNRSESLKEKHNARKRTRENRKHSDPNIPSSKSG